MDPIFKKPSIVLDSVDPDRISKFDVSSIHPGLLRSARHVAGVHNRELGAIRALLREKKFSEANSMFAAFIDSPTVIDAAYSTNVPRPEAERAVDRLKTNNLAATNREAGSANANLLLSVFIVIVGVAFVMALVNHKWDESKGDRDSVMDIRPKNPKVQYFDR